MHSTQAEIWENAEIYFIRFSYRNAIVYKIIDIFNYFPVISTL